MIDNLGRNLLFLLVINFCQFYLEDGGRNGYAVVSSYWTKPKKLSYKFATLFQSEFLCGSYKKMALPPSYFMLDCRINFFFCRLSVSHVLRLVHLEDPRLNSLDIPSSGSSRNIYITNIYTSYFNNLKKTKYYKLFLHRNNRPIIYIIID